MRHIPLAVVLGLVAPVLAQTESRPTVSSTAAGPTEKLWKIETSGLGGWSAASNAQRISSILKKEKGIKDLIFDTCGVGYFSVGKGYVPAVEALNTLLVQNRMKTVKVTTVAETDVPVADEVWEVSVAGLAWMSTALQTREVLGQLEGVLRVHPFGHNGKALVFVSAKDKFTQEAANKALLQGTGNLRVRKMTRAKA